MEFQQFKDAAANYLEAEGIDSDSVSDDLLWSLWSKGANPADVVAAVRSTVK